MSGQGAHRLIVLGARFGADDDRHLVDQRIVNVAANPTGSGKPWPLLALNVKSGKIDRMRLEYFSDKLVDETVQSLLEPYVARKSG